MELLRKYGEATTFMVPMIVAGAQDFATSSDWTPASGDVKVSKDDGGFVNVGTLPSAVGNSWKFTLSVSEMQAARVVVQVVDQDATKAVEDQQINLVTYGNASAQNAFDLDATLNDPTVAEIRAEIDSNSTKLADILADTHELQTDNVPGLIAALNDLSATEVNAEVDQALADYDPPTKAELDAGFAALNDLTAAEVNAEVDTALADYDAPTKAELDAGFAALNDPTAAAIADAVWDEQISGHLAAGTMGSYISSIQNAVVEDLPGQFDALNDLSAAEVNAEVDAALADYDPPTKAELDAGLAGLNDPTAAEVATAVDSELSSNHGSGAWTASTNDSVTDITYNSDGTINVITLDSGTTLTHGYNASGQLTSVTVA